MAVANHGIHYGIAPPRCHRGSDGDIVHGLRLAGVVAGVLVLAGSLLTLFFLKDPAPVEGLRSEAEAEVMEAEGTTAVRS